MSDETRTGVVEMDPHERAGRRSDHGSSADSWERRDRGAYDERVSRALALLPPEMARRIANPESVVSPLVVAEQAKQMEAAFQALCGAVLDPKTDYAWYEESIQENVNGRIVEQKRLIQRKRKSAWRKLARYFNLDVVIDREVIGHRHDERTCGRILFGKAGVPMPDGEDCACPTVYARYHGRVIAPNGRVGFGVGVASINERRFKAADHSIPATAHTRMLSRAISDMIAAGEAASDDPAETSDAAREEGAPRPVTPDITGGDPLTEAQMIEYTTAWAAASPDRRRAMTRFLEERGYRKGDWNAHGAPDLVEVLDILGAPTPTEAPT